MTKNEAILFINEIEKTCQEKGIWFCLTQEHRPLLGKIKIEISIKVDPNKDN